MFVSRNPEGSESTFAPHEWRALIRDFSGEPFGSENRCEVLRFQTTTPPSNPSVTQQPQRRRDH